MAVSQYGCQHECDACATPQTCEFLREFDARRDEERRSAQMLAGVLLWMLIVATCLTVWLLVTFL